MSAVDAISRWAALGRSLRRPSSKRRADWNAVKKIINRAKPKLLADGIVLGQLLDTSRTRLFPLEDPLDVDLGAHRWLAENREEAYSDWLLQEAGRPGIIQGLAGSHMRPHSGASPYNLLHLVPDSFQLGGQTGWLPA